MHQNITDAVNNHTSDMFKLFKELDEEFDVE